MEPDEEVVHTEECLLVEIPELEQQRPKFFAQKIHHFHELLELCINFRHLVVRYDRSLKIYGAAAGGALTR